MLGACFSALAVLATTLVGLVVTAPPVSADPGDPFDPADAIVFIAQNIPTQLFRVVPDAGGNVSFTAEGDESDITYNAIAYNPADDYIWAVKTSAADAGTEPVTWPAGSIIRIGQGGVMTRVGTETTIPTANVGLIGGDGYFYVNDSAGTEIRRIDPVTGAAAGSYTLPSATGAPDLTYANGYFWGVNGTGGIVRIALTPTPTVDVYPGILPDGVYGAAWTYGNGNLGFSRNNDGSIRQVQVTNPSAPTPTFTILSTQSGPESGNNDGTSSPGLPTDLAITKVGPTPLIPGDTVSYTLTVANNGAGNSSGFVVTDTVPAPLTNVASPTAGCTVAGSTVTCTSGPLLAGQSRDFTVTADVPPGQSLCVTNTASVLGNENDPVPGNNSASVESCPPAPSLVIAKTSSAPPFAVGDVVDYEFHVTNTGNVTITDVVVVDPLLDAPATCPANQLLPDEDMTCTGSRTATQDDLDAGRIENVAHAEGILPSGQPISSPPSAFTVPSVTRTPGLSITKTAGQSGFARVGDVIDFSFLVTNTGNVTITDVAVVDPNLDVPATCPTTVLLPGESTTCTGSRTITRADVDAGELVNSATASGQDPTGSPVVSSESTVRVPFTGSRPSGPGGPGALPRTGGDSAALAAVGVLLLGLGAAMQLSRGARAARWRAGR